MLFSACSFKYLFRPDTDCKTQAYINLQVVEYLSSRYHSKELVRLAILPFDQPETFALKEKGSAVPVVVLSNLGQEEDVKRAKALGAKDYFVKSDTPIANIVEYAKKILGA